MSSRDRRSLRYGLAAGAVVAGGVCAAALTNGLGNTLATVLIGGGLLAFVVMLLHDMGLIDTREPPPPSSRNGSDRGRGPGSANGAGPASEGGCRVNVPRPDRMRGQRRRLR